MCFANASNSSTWSYNLYRTSTMWACAKKNLRSCASEKINTQNKTKMRLIYHTLEVLWMHSSSLCIRIDSHSNFEYKHRIYICIEKETRCCRGPVIQNSYFIYSIDRIQVTIFYYYLFRLRFCVVPMGFPLPQFLRPQMCRCTSSKLWVCAPCKPDFDAINFCTELQPATANNEKKYCILVSFVRIVVILYVAYTSAYGSYMCGNKLRAFWTIST